MNNIQPNANTSARSSKLIWIGAIVVILIAGLGYKHFAGSSASKGSGADATGKAHGGFGDAKPMPVVTSVAKVDDINVYLDGLGAVTPMATATVKSRVDGEIVKILFKEGQMVKKGELLVVVDPRPYQAALTQAEGQLIHDKALLANAKIDLERYRALLKEESIASQVYDTQVALVSQYEGTVMLDEGQLATARLNLTYTSVTAPVSGRAGLRQVDLGNVVHAADTTGIVIVTQLKPMSVVFTLPEDNIPDLVKQMQGGRKIEVDAFDRAFQNKLTTGQLETVDNQIDPTTGMVKLRAVYANNDLSLFPSQFVNSRLLLQTMHNVITIPSAGVQRGKAGTFFAFVVAADSTVTHREVTVGITQGDKSQIVTGLNAGDVVVIDGTDKLREGAKVIASDVNKPAAPSVPDAKGSHKKS